MNVGTPQPELTELDMYLAFTFAVRLLMQVTSAAAVVLAAAPAFALEGYYSDTSKNCHDLRSDQGMRIWRCPGPTGYAALFSDEGNVVEVEYGLAGHERNLGGLQWAGSDNAIGRKIEWRLNHRTPFAAILRIRSLDAEGRSINQLLIAKVSPEGGCRIGLLDAGRPGANLRARLIADARGLVYSCGQ